MLVVRLIFVGQVGLVLLIATIFAKEANSAKMDAITIKKIKLKMRFKRRTLTEDDVLTLVAARYGSLSDFSTEVNTLGDIGKKFGVAKSTVHNAIKKFHGQGHRYVKAVYKGRESSVPKDVQASIVDNDTLEELKYLPIQERARLHSREFGLNITKHKLKIIYKNYKVRFRQPKVKARLTDEKELKLIPERIMFAEQLKILEDAGH